MVVEGVVLRLGRTAWNASQPSRRSPGIQTRGRRRRRSRPCREATTTAAARTSTTAASRAEVDRRGADLEAVLRLEPLVEEEERDRRGQGDRACRLAVDELANAPTAGAKLVSATAALYGGPGRRPDEPSRTGSPPTLNRRVLPRSPAPVSGGRLDLAVAFGILGTVVAARTLGLDEFGVFATALAAVGFFQALLDLTVEESLTKYGFRYVSAQDWIQLRRLFRQDAPPAQGRRRRARKPAARRPRTGGGPCRRDRRRLGAPRGAATARPVRRERRRDRAAPAQPLRPPGRVPDGLGGAPPHRDRDRRAVRRPRGTTAVVVARAVATAAISFVGLSALRRFPHAPPRPLGEDVPGIRSFVLQSTVATGVISLRTTLVRMIIASSQGLHRSASSGSRRRPRRASPRRSSPARLVLLTEQTRDWEGDGTSESSTVSEYTIGAAAVMVVAVPAFFVAISSGSSVVFGGRYAGAVDAARIVLLAAAIQFAIGWTKSLPVTIGRPHLRIVTHGLETLVAIPLVAVLGAEWGATGAAVAVLASTVVFAAAWGVALSRLRSDVGDDPTRFARDGGAVRVLVVSGIWPPDPGPVRCEPRPGARRVPPRARARGRGSSRPRSAPAQREHTVHWVPRSSPLRHARAARLVWSRAAARTSSTPRA